MPRLRDGYPTFVDFSAAAVGGVEIWEISVTPGGVEGGGPNDTTTMRNQAWRTRQPKYLKTLSEGTFTASYDPQFFDTIQDLVNINQLMTVTFPDQSTYTFWGWIDSFVPNEIVEGEQPTAEVTFVPSNQDDNGNEVCPVFTLGAGRVAPPGCP